MVRTWVEASGTAGPSNPERMSAPKLTAMRVEPAGRAARVKGDRKSGAVSLCFRLNMLDW